MNKIFIYTLIVLFVFSLAVELYARFFTNYCEPCFDREMKIIKRKKSTEGIYKTEHTNNGYFRINNQGWNSFRDYYKKNYLSIQDADDEKGKMRIAIVGHSNVEGLRIPVEKTFSKAIKYSDLKFEIGKKISAVFNRKTNDTEEVKQKHYIQNRDSIYEEKVFLGVRYILNEFSQMEGNTKLSLGSKLPIYFIEFPLQIPSFNNMDSAISSNTNSHHIRKMELFARYGFPVINTEETLIDDYRKNQQEFDFPKDGHYNEHAHYVIGEMPAQYFIESTNIFK